MVYKSNNEWFVNFKNDIYGPYGSEAHAYRVLASLEREAA